MAGINREALGKAADLIQRAFIWGESEEGHDYWAHVHERLQAYAQGKPYPVAEPGSVKPVQPQAAHTDWDAGVHSANKAKQAGALVDLALTWSETIEDHAYWNDVKLRLLAHSGDTRARETLAAGSTAEQPADSLRARLDRLVKADSAEVSE